MRRNSPAIVQFTLPAAGDRTLIALAGPEFYDVVGIIWRLHAPVDTQYFSHFAGQLLPLEWLTEQLDAVIQTPVMYD